MIDLPTKQTSREGPVPAVNDSGVLDGYYIYLVCKATFLATCRFVVKQFLVVVVVKCETAFLKVCMSFTFTSNIEEWKDFQFDMFLFFERV